MNALDDQMALTLFSNELMLEIFGELLGPLVIVRRDRHVVFKSHAFERLLGEPLQDMRLPCNLTILPNAEGCCLDAIGTYPNTQETGIWNLNHKGGTTTPVLARWKPVNVGSSMSLLAIQFDPLPDQASALGYSVFRGLARSSEDLNAYWTRVFGYLESCLGPVELLVSQTSKGATRTLLSRHVSDGCADQINAILAATAGRSQDILGVGDKSSKILHAISRYSDDVVMTLVVGSATNPLDRQFLDMAISALEVSGTETAPSHFADRKPDISPDGLFDLLSPAESDILNQIVDGLTDKEIARVRGVSPHTVKNQVKAILHKSGASKRIELVRWLAAVGD
jgi:DNA-binding CsgD family transcriptional regulator